MADLIPMENIANKIYQLRDMKVMLDKDLADLYCIETKQLKRSVRRNINRFPADFMFILTEDEFQNLRCQSGTSSWGGIRYLPMAFTEQGVAMLSSILASDRAIQVNIQIMRTFTQLRRMLSTHEDLRHKIEEMENRYDHNFQVVFDAIKQLISEEQKPKKKIGFKI